MENVNDDRIRRVTKAIGSWAGEDAAEHRTPDAVAEEIDEIYREQYGVTPAEVEAATRAIRAGHEAQEARVA